MVQVKNPNKIFFPQAEIKKKEVYEYYNKISDYMLSYLQDRPLTVKRFPNGINEEGFFQKKFQYYYPEWIESANIKMRSENEDIKQPLCNNKKSLLYFADKGAIEFHPSLSKADDIEKPVFMIFDLDPSDDDFDKVRRGGLLFYEYFKERDLSSFVQLTGSKGIHIVIPLRGDEEFNPVKELSRKIQDDMIETAPNLFTKEHRKNKRENKIFIDVLRNEYGQTGISPYSLRALEKAPIAAPIDWNELENEDLSPQSYNINNIFQRLGQKDDPWENLFQSRISFKSLKDKVGE